MQYKRAAKVAPIGFIIPALITAAYYYYNTTHFYINADGTYATDPYWQVFIVQYITGVAVFGCAGAIGLFAVSLCLFETKSKTGVAIVLVGAAVGIGVVALIIAYFKYLVALVVIGTILFFANSSGGGGRGVAPVKSPEDIKQANDEAARLKRIEAEAYSRTLGEQKAMLEAQELANNMDISYTERKLALEKELERIRASRTADREARMDKITSLIKGMSQGK